MQGVHQRISILSTISGQPSGAQSCHNACVGYKGPVLALTLQSRGHGEQRRFQSLSFTLDVDTACSESSDTTWQRWLTAHLDGPRRFGRSLAIASGAEDSVVLWSDLANYCEAKVSSARASSVHVSRTAEVTCLW